MTNEEAIEELKRELKEVNFWIRIFRDNKEVYEPNKRWKQAIKKSIFALEQQTRNCKTCKHSDNGNCAYTEECHECMWESKYEQQPCEDYVSRETVKDMLTETWTKYVPMELDINLSFVLEKISELPSVTPRAESEE